LVAASRTKVGIDSAQTIIEVATCVLLLPVAGTLGVAVDEDAFNEAAGVDAVEVSNLMKKAIAYEAPGETLSR
jgi:hypothetical protein